MGFLSRLTGGTTSRKENALTVHASGLVDVVGESFRQDALRRLATLAKFSTPFLKELTGGALDEAKGDTERRWFRAALMREPDNEHDPNAIAVYADGVGKIGYLSRGNAIRYKPVFAALSARGYSIAACPAFLMGGTEGAPRYGVMLCLSTPKRVVADLAES